MNCKEFEKLIPDFLNKKMDFLTARKFHEHMSQCPGCSEEMEIQFLVTEGMSRLEDGDAFDLQSELYVQLGESERKIRLHNFFLRAGLVLEGIAAFALIIIVALILL